MDQPSDTIRIVIIDDQVLFRAGLCLLLESQPGFRIVGETGNIAEVIELVTSRKPDVVLLETNLSGGTAVEIIPSLIEKIESAKVILVTGNCDPQIHMIAFQMGAVGIIQKNQPPDLLYKAIRKVHRGEVWIERAMMANLLSKMTNHRNRIKANQDEDKINLLTQREREVLSWVGKGFKNRDIAHQLSISETTVSHHLTSIFNKLGVSDRLEMVIFSYRFGLAKPPVRNTG
jgi:DNA-binding NarL/FixJ family response regulator